MSQSEQKIVQYLNEAHALEVGLVQVLRTQAAMAPEGPLRDGLAQHLQQTKTHADRVKARQNELTSTGDPFAAGLAFMSDVVAQTLALWKAPLDLMRGASLEEKVLENTKEACAAEALEIATYTALEHLARGAGDDATAELAASIRADEERMRDHLTGELPKLARAVVTDGSADVVAEAQEVMRETADDTPVPTADDLAIPGYDALTAEDVGGRLAGLSQDELAAVDAYEQANANRATVRRRIETLRAEEPWEGYDALTVGEIRTALADDDERADAVRTYERAHKNRAGVITAVEREASAAA
jgi:ferritin-like metal-binding protein YciE